MSALHLTSASTNQYVDLPASSAVNNLDPFTVMAWVRLTEALPGAVPRILDLDGQGYFSFSTFLGGAYEYRLHHNYSTTYAAANSGDVLSLNTWYLLAGVYDTGATWDCELYRGSLTSAVINESSTKQNGAGTPGTSTACRIGNRASANSSNGMRGDLARLAIYDIAMTTAQIEECRLNPELWIHHPSLVFSSLPGYGEVTGTITDYGPNAIGSNSSTGSPTLTDEPPLAMPWEAWGRAPVLTPAGVTTIPLVPGALALAGVALGLEEHIGLSPATLTLAGVALGLEEHIGLSPAALALAGVALGLEEHIGLSPAALALAGATLGLEEHIGLSPAVLVITGATLGLPAGGAVEVALIPASLVIMATGDPPGAPEASGAGIGAGVSAAVAGRSWPHLAALAGDATIAALGEDLEYNGAPFRGQVMRDGQVESIDRASVVIVCRLADLDPLAQSPPVTAPIGQTILIAGVSHTVTESAELGDGWTALGMVIT